MALKLFAGRHRTRTYHTREELLDFGRRICRVSQPARVLQAIAQAQQETLAKAQGDSRIPPDLLRKLQAAWSQGQALA